MKNQWKNGFTLLEALGALVLFTLAVGMAMSGYLFSLKNINASDAQDELDMDVLIALESLKRDLRLSSLDQIYYYPEGAGPYQAISFPRAYDSDGDGLVELDSNGKVIWDETVIYHIRPTTPHELVKTTFFPRDNSLSDGARKKQLDLVVSKGDGSSAPNGVNASSRVLFSNLVNWNITALAGHFDAYASTPKNKSVNLGYRLLDGGPHEFKFNIVGKNENSSGYGIVLDKMVTAAPTVEQEAESLVITNQVGATAENIFDPSNGENLLSFPAGSLGDSFCLIMDIDKWVETNFRGGDKKEVFLQDTTIEFDQTMDPPDYVVQLKGNGLAWESSLQTGSQPTDPVAGSMRNWAVRVLQKGADLADSGNWLAFNGERCRLRFDSSSSAHLKISNVYIGEAVSSTNAVLDYDVATVKPVTFNNWTESPVAGGGESIVSDWIDMPIEKEKNYIISYRLDSSAAACNPAIWTDMRDSVAATTLVVTNGLAISTKAESWYGQYGVTPVPIKGVVGVSAIETSYPSSGYYISQIFDTGVAEPKYRDISWNADVPTGTSISFKVRTGSKPDLSDASDWGSVTTFNSSRSIPASYKRYIQFMALLSSSSGGVSSPTLKDVSIDWDGGSRMVSVGCVVAQRPQAGKVKIEVDGEELRSALKLDLEIYKEIYMMRGTTARISSSMKVDITPRNTGL
ncbi:MAG TPA: hypothetical protein VIR63_06200 [Pontiella sp.]